ncbi:MAG: TraR/DksA family transcriptional regulator [Noviherbaspirillum sp.]
MDTLSAQQLDQLKSQLARRETELRGEIHRELSGQNDYNEMINEVPDAADSSFANLEVDLGNAAVTRDIRELRAIQTARARIDNGSYGSCAECGNPIPVERLKAQPTAERCAPCQERYEKTHADSRGPTL